MSGNTLALAGFALLAALAFARAMLERRNRGHAVFAAAGSAEILFIGLLIGTLVVLGAVQIFLRNAFNSGLLWADPLMRHIVLWLGASGAALASARMRHISVDALTRVLPDSFRPARRVVVYLATAVAAYLLAIATVRLVIDERSFGEVAFLGVHTWVLQLILPGAFVLITYRSILALLLGREPAETARED
ncbi:MAG TPA: TRAP transporter small permease subunit [Candidatus Krumholzibacteria bacterium]|nr:TRAP transporter small permease subunit [Candidatus Krumholzibacteria bacterium]